MQGDFRCGVFTLAGDLLKGFVPVYFYLLHLEPPGIALAFAVAAPTVVDIFPQRCVLQLVRQKICVIFQALE